MILTHKSAIRSENVKGHVLAESVSTGCRARTTSYAATETFPGILGRSYSYCKQSFPAWVLVGDFRPFPEVRVTTHQISFIYSSESLS